MSRRLLSLTSVGSGWYSLSLLAATVLMVLAVLAGGADTADAASPSEQRKFKTRVNGEFKAMALATGVSVPSSAGFGETAFAAHKCDFSFFSAGSPASAGVQALAEDGSISAFETAVDAAVSDGNAQEFWKIDPPNGPGKGKGGPDIQIKEEFSCLTVLVKINPTSDWFAGVSAHDLRAGGTWPTPGNNNNHIFIDLFPFDAGTLDGTEFAASTVATSPQGTITSLRNSGKFSNNKIARLRLTMKDPALTKDVAAEEAIESIIVTWGEVVAAGGYHVMWKSGAEAHDTDGSLGRRDVVGGGKTKTHTITGLTGGVEHEVQVIAYNEAGQSSQTPTSESKGRATPISAATAGNTVLVGNTTQRIPGTERLPIGSNAQYRARAQAFTTGPEPAVLGSVTLPDFRKESNNSVVDVHIYSASGVDPDAELYTLTRPDFSSFSSGVPTDITFNAAAADTITLAINTTYFVVVESVQAEVGLAHTKDDDEDPETDEGWSIANTCRREHRDGTPNSDCERTGSSTAALIMVLNSPLEAVKPVLSISGSEAVEGTGIQFTVSLSPALGEEVTVEYSTADDTATTADSDYTAVSAATLTFAANETEKTVTIATTADSTDEDDESFNVVLSSPSENAQLGYVTSASGLIINNDQTTQTDGTLSSITLTGSDGATIALTPAFSQYKFLYTATADREIDSLTGVVTPSTSGVVQSIMYVGGSEDTVTTAYDAVWALVPGDNLIKFMVTSPDGSRTKIYKIHVNKDPSTDATLSDLTLVDNNGTAITLSPAFNSATTEYTASVGAAVSSVTLTGTQNYSGATMSNNLGPDTLSGQATLDTWAGEFDIEIDVTAEDGATTKRYTVTAERILQISFGSAAYSVDEGAMVEVSVLLNGAPGDSVRADLSTARQGGATTADYRVPTNVVFASGETSKMIPFSATQDSDNDPDESVKIGFDTLPTGYEAGATSETTVSMKNPQGTIVRETIAPMLLVATVDGTSMALIYSEALDTSSVPAVSDFGVSIESGTAAAPSSVNVVGAKVKLTLSSEATNMNTVTVTYMKPETNPLRDLAGNDAAALDTEAVTNNTGATNNQPAFSSDAVTRSVAENTVTGTAIGDAVTATDSDTLTYSLPDGFSTFTIGTNTGQLETLAMLNHEETSFYLVPIYVSDGKDAADSDDDHAIDDTIAVTITVTNVNEAPTIDAGRTDYTVAENTATSTVIETYEASDPDASPTFTWTLEGTDGGDFTITRNSDGEGEVKFRNVPDFEMPTAAVANEYHITVRVTDNGSLSDTRDVIITVTNVDEPGVVAITGTLSGGEELTASVTDIDGTVSSETWRWALGNTQGGSFSNISGATNASYTTTANDVGKYLQATASYTDAEGSGKSASAVTTSAIGASNSAPTFSSSTATRTLPENSGAGVNVAGGTITAADNDNDTLTYSLASGGDNASFEIDSSGQIKTKTGVTHNFNFEGTKNSYTVTVRVSDGKDAAGGTDTSTIDDTITVTINLTNVNEAPTITSPPSSTSVPENSTTVHTFAASDVDASDTLGWSVESTDDGSFFEINSSGQLSFITAPNFEVKQDADNDNVYEVTVKVADAGGLNATHKVAVTVNNVNEAPTIDSGPNDGATVSEDENTATTEIIATYEASDVDAGANLTWSLEGDDASDFTLIKNSMTGKGELRFMNVPNYEAPADAGGNNDYEVTIKVSDGSRSATRDLTVTVEDVNEAPTITSPPSSKSVPENTTAVHTFAASDVDASDTLGWSVESADDGSFFEINSSGQLSFKTAPNFEDKLDADTDNVYEVTVKVTDNGSPQESDTHKVAVTVTNVNEAPTIDSGQTGISKDENTPTTEIIATYEASDQDAGANLTWSLEGVDAGDFRITENSVTGNGELKFRNVPNYEAPADAGVNNDYEVTIKVSDGSLNATRVLTVTVEDVNETPVISGDAAPDFAEIEFDATSSVLTIGTYLYTDEDLNPPDTITWDLSGTDAAHFSISSGGELSFSIEPNFEVPVDMSSSNDYVIVVEANDGEGGIGTYDVTVEVTNVDETPEVTSNNPTHNFAEIEYDYVYADVDLRVDIFTARDEEDGTGGITWAVSGTDGADFTISSGVTTGEGVLFFRPNSNRNVPDFERPGDDDTDNVYNIILKATDTTLPYKTRDYPVTVTVTDVDETPEFRSPSTGRHAHEIEYDSGTTAAELSSIPATVANQDYWYRFEVRDEEGQDIIWSITGLDEADFVIAEDPDFVMTANADESAIARWNIVPDFEDPRGSSTHVVGQGYVFTVNASDGTNTATHEFFIRIEDVNETPEFTGTPNLAITYNENDITDVSSYAARDEEGGVTWSLTGADASDFSIDSGGTVTFVNTPDYETPTGSQDDGTDIDGNVYTFMVEATDVDSGPSRRKDTRVVTVTVMDLEEAGTITVENLYPVVGDRVKFTLKDPDGGIDDAPPIQGQPPPIAWTLQLRLPVGVWQTKQTNNPLGTDFHYVVDEDDTGKKMRVVVTYSDRRGPGKSVTSMETEAITENPIINVKPRFTGEGGTQSIEEVDAGQTVGDPITASDRDPDSLTFSIEGAHSDKFELVVVNNTTVRLRTAQALDFETTSGPLFLQVAVHDGKGVDSTGMVITDDSIDATTTVTVTILDVEEDGVLTLSDDEPGVGTRITATLTDGDSINSNGNVTGARWQWARLGNVQTGWTNISGATSPSYTTTLADADSFLRARVEYTDTRPGGKSAEAITTERVFGENQRPTFPSTETGQRTLPENTRSGVNVGAPVAADDPEGDRLVYTLAGMDAAAFSIVTTTGQLRTLEPLDFEDKSSYRVNVEVHDGLDGLGDPSTSIDDTQAVTITIENVEEQGTVTLSSDTGTIQARVPVTATLADDDRPTGVVMWQWWRSPNGRTDWVNIAGATSATFEPTLAEDQGNYIRATASYTDGHGTADKTANAVSPRVGDAPPVNSAPAFPSTENGQREVAEDATGSANVGAPVVARDFNNDTLYYSLSGTDAVSFEIGQNNGQLRLASGVKLDFEGKRSYRFTVEVSDRADPLDDPDMAIDARQNVTVTVTNVNEAPEVTGDTAPSFVENGSNTVASYTGTDPERDTLTWTVSGSDFWISDRGQLYFRSPPSYEQRTSYTVTVMAEDDDGLTGSLSVTVTVTDAEEEGTITINPPRGWDGTTFTAGLEDDDDDGITGETRWQWARSPNGRSSWTDIASETSDSYTAGDDDVNQYLRATASYEDRRGSNKTASAAVKGRIEDSTDRPTTNNAPAFTEDDDDTVTGRTTTRSVSEGTSAGRNVGSPVRATDEDTGDVLTYSLGGTNALLFDINPATGQILTKAVLDYDPDGTNSYSVEVRVLDGFGPDYLSTDVVVDDTITVTISVTQARGTSSGGGRSSGGGGGGGGGGGSANRPPEITGPKNLQYPENSAEPVATYEAEDPEGTAIRWEIEDTDEEHFRISEDGVLSFKKPPDYENPVDFRLNNTYEIRLLAFDSGIPRASGRLQVRIEIKDVDLPGVPQGYDANDDEMIALEEAIAALAAFSEGVITREEATAIIKLYFSNPTHGNEGDTP